MVNENKTKEIEGLVHVRIVHLSCPTGVTKSVELSYVITYISLSKYFEYLSPVEGFLVNIRISTW